MADITWKSPAKGICRGMDVVEQIIFARVMTTNDGRTFEASAVHLPGVNAAGENQHMQPREFWTQDKLDAIAETLVEDRDHELQRMAEAEI